MAGDDSRKVSDRVREVLSQRSITGPVAVEEVREQLASGAAEETAPELETEAPPAPAGTDEGVAPTVPSPPARQPVPSPPPPIPLAAPAREPSVSIGYLRAIGPADRQHATAVIVGGLALSALGALLGAVLSYSMLHSAGYLGNATAVAAIAIATAPLVIALMALSVWSRSAAFSAALALGGFLAGTGIASLTGLIHYSNNPRMYFIIVNVIAGLGLGVASICLRRELRTMLIALGLGALGGLVAGAVTPIAVFTHRGAWTATQTLSGVIGAAPLCVLIAFLPRASRVARAPSELEPSAAGESPATS